MLLESRKIAWEYFQGTGWTVRAKWQNELAEIQTGR